MNLPSIFDWLERLDFLRGTPAAYGILVTSVVILVVWDWRVTLLALTAHYLIASFLFVDLLDARLVNVKVLIGLFIALILYMTARQVNWGRLPADLSELEAASLSQRRGPSVVRESVWTTVLFRAFLALMLLLIVFTLAQRPEFQLPAVPRSLNHINLAVYMLIGSGLLGIGSTSQPLRAGIYLLLFLTGFELFYSALEQSVVILAMLAVANLAVTLAIAFLTQARHAISDLVE